jgi:hypothetical protein
MLPGMWCRTFTKSQSPLVMLLLQLPTFITVCHEIHDSSNDPTSAVPRFGTHGSPIC